MPTFAGTCVRSSTSYSSSLSPERITGGLPGRGASRIRGRTRDEGGRALKTFVESGGTLVSLDQAGGFAISALALPVRDVTRDIRTDTFFGPGSIVRVEVDPTQPLAYGMSPHTAGFFVFSSPYETLASSDTTTAARFGDKDLLLSGWLEGEQTIAGRSAVVRQRGTGRVILMGFAQHRHSHCHVPLFSTPSSRRGRKKGRSRFSDVNPRKTPLSFVGETTPVPFSVGTRVATSSSVVCPIDQIH